MKGFGGTRAAWLFAPTGLYSSPNPSTTGTYTLSWGNSTDATYWEVDEKYQHDTPITWRQVAAPTSRSWSPPSPKTGYGDYTYRVRACNSKHQCSLNSAEHIQKVHLPNVLPERPATGTVSPNPSTTGLYTLTWPAAARATRYRLKENDGSPNWTELPEQTTRSWSPSAPKENGFYAYHIQGCNLYGCGDWTLVAAQVRVEIPTELPMTVPSNFAVSGGFLINTWMKFTWATVEGAAMYQIRQELFSCHGQGPTYLVVGAATPQPYQQRATLGMCSGQQQDPSTWHFSIRACADLQGNRCSEYSPTVSVTTAGTGSDPWRAATTTTTTYIHTDGLRSPVAETDATGQVTARMRYEPYGKTLSATPPSQGPGYTGHVSDERTGLSYMQQRYYDPIAGRFLSVDPVPANPASFNRYWYANNNPYRYIDPDGRKITALDEGQQKEIEKLINSQTSKQYKFNEGGNLKATGETNDGGSDKYSAAVDKAIGSKVTVQIGFAQNYKLPGNEVRSIDKDNGGGLTSRASSDLIKIRISGNSVRFPTAGGKIVTDGPEDVLRHEIVGHAVPLLQGIPRANSVELDNATREELGRPSLRADPKHTADWW